MDIANGDDAAESLANGSGSSQDKKSASTVLVELAEQSYTFGVSDGGDVFAVPREGPQVVLLLRGGKTSLRAQLARAYFRRTGRAAPQQALADALLVLEGLAQEQDAQPLHLRVANHDNVWWLDLGDHTGRAVAVTGEGWSIHPQPPVQFRRGALTSPLPEPAAGDLDELWSWLNVCEADRPLVAAWLVSVLTEDVPHTVLGLFGEHGSGKSTALQVLGAILDPSPVQKRKPPRDAESWVTAASGSWVVGLDNLSDIPPWLSDSLARASTGEGDVRRKLYSDNDIAVFSFRRCIALNGIDLGALAPDLADRLLPIDLDRIAESDRLDESELWPAWTQAHPRILGAVLDLAASVSHTLPSVRLQRKPRMADYARVLAAVDHVLGTDGLARYRSRAIDLAADGLSGHPLAVAISEAVTEPFEGTSAQLLAQITPDRDGWRPPKGWPADARQVTAQLRRIAPPLRKIGWTVTDLGSDNHDKSLRWLLEPPSRPEKARTDTRPHPQHPQHAPSAGVAGGCGYENGQSQDDEPPPAPTEDHPMCPVCGEPYGFSCSTERRHPECRGTPEDDHTWQLLASGYDD